MPAELWPQPVLDLLAAGGDRPVFEDGDRVVTAAEMSGLVRRIAAGLRAAGVGPGDGVALRARGHAGGVRRDHRGLRRRRPGLRDPARPRPRRNSATLLAQRRRAARRRGPAWPRLAAPPADDGVPLRRRRPPDDIARIIWTSGSTGNPKGCAQTYAAMSAAWAPYPDRWPPAIAELAARLRRYLVFGSLSSQVMLEYGVLTLAAGGTLVVAARRPSPT